MEEKKDDVCQLRDVRVCVRVHVHVRVRVCVCVRVHVHVRVGLASNCSHIQSPHMRILRWITQLRFFCPMYACACV